MILGGPSGSMQPEKFLFLCACFPLFSRWGYDMGSLQPIRRDQIYEHGCQATRTERVNDWVRRGKWWRGKIALLLPRPEEKSEQGGLIAFHRKCVMGHTKRRLMQNKTRLQPSNLNPAPFGCNWLQWCQSKYMFIVSYISVTLYVGYMLLIQ